MFGRFFKRNLDNAKPNVDDFWSNSTRPFKDYPQVELRYFPSQSDRTLVVIPGYMSSGIKPKYEQLITKMTEQDLASVLSTNYTPDIEEQIPLTLWYMIARGRQKLTLLGSSAGGGAVVLALEEFGYYIDSVILTAPSIDLLIHDYKDMVSEFAGKVYLIRTDGDEVCSPEVLEIYRGILKNADFHVVELPGNDHSLDEPENTYAVIKLVEDAINSLDKPTEP